MTVVVDRCGSVIVVRIDRPEARNALDPATCDAIADALADAAADDVVRAVVLTGTGDLAFCAGMDLKAFAKGDHRASRITPILREGFPKPLVAAVNGPAVGGGFELVLACDLVVAADHAWFALPEVQRGLFPAGGGAVVLPRRLPLSIALEVGLTGARLDASRAEALGLVNRLVPAAAVLDTAVALAKEAAANGPLGVRATKALMWAAPREPALWAQVDAHRAVVFESDEAKEGARAFVERRPPAWRPADIDAGEPSPRPVR